jgi:hypothetical protein
VRQTSTGPLVALIVSITAAVTFAATGPQTLPAEALLPATSMLVFVLAAFVALIAWRCPLPPRQFTYWDSAGVLTLIGVFATAMVDPSEMVRLVEGAPRR